MNSTANWKQVKEIFASALEKGPDGRDAFISEQCGGDEALKFEVESWLASYAESEDFIDTPLLSPDKLFSNGSPAEGRRFGNYTIIREIGHGGMGAVFLAERNDGEFEQRVALKIVRQSISESHMIERFRSERQILASLNHANIAKLLDGGVSELGEPFLAMEYIDGEPLLEFAAGLSVKERLRLFLKICSAVSYAHRNLIIHRDIKPSNILVTSDGEPILLDFGLAKIAEAGLTGENQTQTAFHALTPAYASPEQMRGIHVTTASDIYSLGVVLYELLTNERPFHFEGKSLEEIIKTVTEIEPPLPSANPRTKVQNLKLLSGDLDNITLMALRREPERRYSSVEHFAGDVRLYLNELPISARPNTISYRASKFLKRNKVSMIAASLIFLSLIAGIAATLQQSRLARDEKMRAETVSGFLQEMLSYSEPDSMMATVKGRDITVKDVLNDASARLANGDLSDQPEVKAELLTIIGRSYFSQGKYDLAEKNLSEAVELKRHLYGTSDLRTVRTLGLWASFLASKSDFALADEIFRHILPVLKTELSKGNVDANYLIETIHEFAVLRRAQGDSKEAETLLREGLTFTPPNSGRNFAPVMQSQATLALTLADQGRFDEAVRMAREVVANSERAGTDESSSFGYALTALGSYLTEQREFAEGDVALKRAEGIYRRLLSPSHLFLGDNLRIQANSFYLQGDYARAELKIDETLKIYKESSGVKYINLPTAMTIKGVIYDKTNRRYEAETILSEAVAIRAETLPSTHFLLATATGALGESLTSLGRFDDAEDLLNKSFDSLKLSQESNSPRLAQARARLISLYQTWGKPERAAQFAN